MIWNEKKAKRNGYLLAGGLMSLVAATGFSLYLINRTSVAPSAQSESYISSVQRTEQKAASKQEKKLEDTVQDSIQAQSVQAIKAGQPAIMDSTIEPVGKINNILEQDSEQILDINLERPTPGYPDFVDKMQTYVEHFRIENLLQKDSFYMSQFYSNFSATDMITLVRCVFKEAGARKWCQDEKRRKLENLQDVVPILASIANRWITSQYDPSFKNDFNGPGEISFSNILNKKTVKKWIGKKKKEHSLTTYQFSAMMNPEERENIRLACEQKDLFYGIEDQRSGKKNPYDVEKIKLIYEAAKIVLPELAKNPNLKSIALNISNAQVPAGYFVLYKTKSTDYKVWHNVTIKGRTRKNIGTSGNHRYYTVEDSRTGENLIQKSRVDYSNAIKQKMQQQ